MYFVIPVIAESDTTYKHLADTWKRFDWRGKERCVWSNERGCQVLKCCLPSVKTLPEKAQDEYKGQNEQNILPNTSGYW